MITNKVQPRFFSIPLFLHPANEATSVLSQPFRLVLFITRTLLGTDHNFLDRGGGEGGGGVLSNFLSPLGCT